MDAENERLRDEITELGEAVRTLRDELAAERLARAALLGHGCHCAHPVWVYPYAVYPPYRPVPWTPPFQIWSGGTAGAGPSGIRSTSNLPGAAGGGTTYALSLGS